MNIFDRIDAWLKENGVSRRKLALKANLPPSSLQSALTRRKKMSFDMLEALAKAMGVSVDYLAYGMTENDIAIERLSDDLSDYGYAIEIDTSNELWCYVYPSDWEDEAEFKPEDDGKHLPISFLEEKLRSAVAEGERFRKQYVQKCIKNCIDTADEMQLGALWETGDL